MDCAKPYLWVSLQEDSVNEHLISIHMHGMSIVLIFVCVSFVSVLM